MKKIKNILNKIILLVLISTPNIVNADSGLDSNYESSSSMIGGIINAIMSIFSSFGQLFAEYPGSKDYNTARIIIVIMSLITLFIVTAINIFKLNKNKKTIIKLGISLIPTIIYTLICFLIDLPVIIYPIILIIYIIPFIIISKSIIKKRFKKEMIKVKEIDKNFNEEDFNKEAFNIYKEIQLSWCESKIDKIKELISEKLYDKYIKKLEELDKKKQKNIMSDIEYKSNKIIDIELKDNIEIITCEMDVKCIDYIIDDKEKVVKGKKDKPFEYKYKLVFNKDIKNNKYILIEKKIKKIK